MGRRNLARSLGYARDDGGGKLTNIHKKAPGRAGAVHTISIARISSESPQNIDSHPDESQDPWMGNYYVYTLASKKNGTLYVGVTNDLTRRV